MARPGNPSPPSSDRDRWQLLNLYVDGVANAAERQACEALLAEDPRWQARLQQLRQLRAAMQSLPVEPPSRSAADLAAGVFARVEQRHNRHQRWLVAAGVALVALVGGSQWLLGDRSLQVAQQPPTAPWGQSTDASGDSLILALDEPVMPLPSAVQNAVYESSR